MTQRSETSIQSGPHTRVSTVKSTRRRKRSQPFFFTLPVILDLLLKWNRRFDQKLCFFLFPCGGLSGGKFPAHDLSSKCCARVKTEPVRKRDGVWCCFLENRSAGQEMLSQTRSHFTPHLLRPSASHTPSVKYIP